MTNRPPDAHDAQLTRAARRPMRTATLGATIAVSLLLVSWGLMGAVSMVAGPADVIAGALLALAAIGFAVALAARHRALKQFDAEVRGELEH